MANRKIVWTHKANLERKAILEYWIDRNKSKNYSIKLNQLFIDAIKKIALLPTIGKITDYDHNVRLKIVRNYLIFYEYNSTQIIILSIWDTNRSIDKQ